MCGSLRARGPLEDGEKVGRAQANLLDRQFDAEGSKFYLAAIIDSTRGSASGERGHRPAPHDARSRSGNSSSVSRYASEATGSMAS